MDETQRKLADIAYEADAIRSQATEAQRQYGTLQGLLGELDEAMTAIQALKTNPAATLVALGAGAFAPARTDSGKVLVDVGAGVLSEKTPDGALKVLDEKRARVAQAAERLEGVLSQFQARLNDLSAKAAELQGQ